VGELNRQDYFSSLKRLKKELKHLQIHPIFNLGKKRQQKTTLNETLKSTQPKIIELNHLKKKALASAPIYRLEHLPPSTP